MGNVLTFISRLQTAEEVSSGRLHILWWPLFTKETVYASVIHARGERKPILSSVCFLTRIHVELSEGPVQMSQVEEVMQHLTTMSHATQSAKRLRKQQKIFFFSFTDPQYGCLTDALIWDEKR